MDEARQRRGPTVKANNVETLRVQGYGALSWWACELQEGILVVGRRVWGDGR